MRAYGSTEARRECGTVVGHNRAGVTSSRELQSDPDAVVWRGSDVPTVQQGIKILGTPLGHHDHAHQLERVADEHQRFMDMLPSVPNLHELVVSCALRISQGELLVAHCVPTQCAGFCGGTRQRLVGVCVHVAQHSDPPRPVDTGHGHLSIVFGRFGSSECRPNEPFSFLG